MHFWTLSYPWHPNGPRHTLVVSTDSPDPHEQSPTTLDPSPDLSDLHICVPEPPAVSPSPSVLSLISIWPDQPFLTPTTSPKPVWWFLVMLTLSILVLCPIGLQPLPNALGSFPAPFPTLSDWYLAQTTYPKPYRPSSAILTYANLPEPVSTPICYPDTSGLLCHAYSVYGKPHQAYLILSDASWPPWALSSFPWPGSMPITHYCDSCPI